MRASVSALVVLILAVPLLCLTPNASSQQTETDRFEVRGTVLNSANNQPIADAMVDIGGTAQFTDSNGAFSFSDVPRGQFTFTARKPGFFNSVDLGMWGPGTMESVPVGHDIILTLVPEAVVFGEVKGEDGEPVESLTVKAQRWMIENGRRRLQTLSQTTTDDLGEFRIPELRPGTYYVSFQPMNQGVSISVASKLKPTRKDAGYGSQFYPGVSDLASASAIQLHAGAQIHLVQTLAAQQLFDVRGVVNGFTPDRGINLTLNNISGESVQNRVRIASTGEFEIQGVPAGTYLLMASAWNQMPDSADFNPRPLIAALPLTINSNISGIVLPLQRGISLGVRVQSEITTENAQSNMPQVSVELIGQDYLNFAEGISVPQPEGNPRAPTKFEGLFPGTYIVRVTPYNRAYVADLRCGSVDLLQDDLQIASGASPPAIEATLRDDGADLNVTVTDKGQPAPSSVLIYSQEYPKRSVLMPNDGMLSVSDLPPGIYQIIAFPRGEDVEYQNPASIEQYLQHAKAITLTPRGKATVQLDLHESEESR